MARTYKLAEKEKQLRENYNFDNNVILLKSLSDYLNYHFSSSYVRPKHRLYFRNVGQLIAVKDSSNMNIGTISTDIGRKGKGFLYIIDFIDEDDGKCYNYNQVKLFIQLYKQKHIEGE